MSKFYQGNRTILRFVIHLFNNLNLSYLVYISKKYYHINVLTFCNLKPSCDDQSTIMMNDSLLVFDIILTFDDSFFLLVGIIKDEKDSCSKIRSFVYY